MRNVFTLFAAFVALTFLVACWSSPNGQSTTPAFSSAVESAAEELFASTTPVDTQISEPSGQVGPVETGSSELVPEVVPAVANSNPPSLASGETEPVVVPSDPPAQVAKPDVPSIESDSPEAKTTEQEVKAYLGVSESVEFVKTSGPDGRLTIRSGEVTSLSFRLAGFEPCDALRQQVGTEQFYHLIDSNLHQISADERYDHITQDFDLKVYPAGPIGDAERIDLEGVPSSHYQLVEEIGRRIPQEICQQTSASELHTHP